MVTLTPKISCIRLKHLATITNVTDRHIHNPRWINWTVIIVG